MKGLTKIIIDIGPLAIFFIFYTRGEEGEKLQSAILPLMIATIAAILISYILEKKNTNHANFWGIYYFSFWRTNDLL